MKENYLLLFITFNLIWICVEAKEKDETALGEHSGDKNSELAKGRDGKCKFSTFLWKKVDYSRLFSRIV